MKKMINKTHIQGYLYESTLEERVAGEKAANPGAKFISGKLSIQIEEDNIITVDIFESELTKAKTLNKKYGTLKSLMDSKSVVINGIEEAARLKIDSAFALNEWYRDDGELVSTLRNLNGFIHNVNPSEFNPSATFEVDILITSVTDSMVKNEDGTLEPDGNLIVKGHIFDFMGRLMPVQFSVENEGGIKYFRDLEPNTLTKVWGKMVTQISKVSKTEESAFGDDKVIEYINTRKKYVITGTNKDPYLFGETDVLTVDEVKEAIANRNILLAELKARQDESRKTAGATTIASASNEKKEFSF